MLSNRCNDYDNSVPVKYSNSSKKLNTKVFRKKKDHFCLSVCLSVCLLAASILTNADVYDVTRSRLDVYKVLLSFLLLLLYNKSKISCKIK